MLSIRMVNLSASTLMAAEAAQDQGPTILAVCWVLVIVPGLIVGLRIYCKVMLSRGFGWDDSVILLSWALLLIFTGMVTRSIRIGVIGKHIDTIEDQIVVPHALKLIYIGFVVVIMGCVLSKTSFAITLLRIVTKTWMKVLLWFIIITMNAIMWLCAICYLIQCKPTAALWNTELMGTATCWPTIVFETIALSAGAYSGCMDLILALLPWAILWRLQMRRREKFGIAIAMSMGVFASATAFIKTSKLVNISQVQDFTWYCSSIIIWASAETGCTIFAASIPSLRIIFIRMRSSYDRTDEPSYGSYQLSGKYRGQKSSRPPPPDPYYYCQGEPIILTTRKDDGSEKSILAHSPAIKQTHEISITYERTLDEERSLDARVEAFRASRRS